MKAIVCSLCVLAGLLSVPASARPQPPVPQGRVVVEPRFKWEVRFVRVGNTYQGIRYQTKSGETWLIVIDKWEKLKETGKVPPGDYDIELVAGDNDFTAFRFDHNTGKTWILSGQKWQEVKEEKK